MFDAGESYLHDDLMTTCATTTAAQAEKAQLFRRLRERDRAFIIPNPWDVGSARVLVHPGFEALATTSMGDASSTGEIGSLLAA